MQKLHKIRIENKSDATKVFVDDQEIHGLQEISFNHKAGKIPYVTLGIYPKCVELDGCAYIDVNDDLERCLHHLLNLTKEMTDERAVQKERDKQAIQTYISERM